jgi:hypothetical protein
MTWGRSTRRSAASTSHNSPEGAIETNTPHGHASPSPLYAGVRIRHNIHSIDICECNPIIPNEAWKIYITLHLYAQMIRKNKTLNACRVMYFSGDIILAHGFSHSQVGRDRQKWTIWSTVRTCILVLGSGPVWGCKYFCDLVTRVIVLYILMPNPVKLTGCCFKSMYMYMEATPGALWGTICPDRPRHLH